MSLAKDVVCADEKVVVDPPCPSTLQVVDSNRLAHTLPPWPLPSSIKTDTHLKRGRHDFPNNYSFE